MGLAKSVLLEQLFDCGRRRRRAADNSYFCCFAVLGSYQKASGRPQQHKGFHYEEVSSFGPTYRAQGL